METLKEFFRALNPTRWAVLIAAILLLILTVFVIGRCSTSDDLKKSREETALGNARTESATEAIREIGKLRERGDIGQQELKEAQDAIRQANPDDRDRVARYELCRLQHRSDCDRLL